VIDDLRQSVSQSVGRSVSYLVGDFDEESKDDDDEQVVDDADGSNDDVAQLECDIADVSQVQVQLSVVTAICRRLSALDS